MKAPIKRIALWAGPLLILFCTFARAQEIASSAQLGASASDLDSADAPYVIFSNLDSTPGDHFPSDLGGLLVAGKTAAMTENWKAIRFVPKVDVQATVLQAAIAYTPTSSQHLGLAGRISAASGWRQRSSGRAP